MTQPMSAPSSAAGERDWTDQVTDLIVDTVDQIRTKTTGPVMGGVRALVFVVMALLLALPVVVLMVAGTIRLLDWAIPGDVWIVYAAIGSVLLLGGLAIFGKREVA